MLWEHNLFVRFGGRHKGTTTTWVVVVPLCFELKLIVVVPLCFELKLIKHKGGTSLSDVGLLHKACPYLQRGQSREGIEARDVAP